MNTECIATQLEFQGLGRRQFVVAFDGGHLSSDGGVLSLRDMDEGLGRTARPLRSHPRLAPRMDISIAIRDRLLYLMEAFFGRYLR